jgi:hypothetical protein
VCNSPSVVASPPHLLKFHGIKTRTSKHDNGSEPFNDPAPRTRERKKKNNKKKQ